MVLIIVKDQTNKIKQGVLFLWSTDKFMLRILCICVSECVGECVFVCMCGVGSKSLKSAVHSGYSGCLFVGLCFLLFFNDKVVPYVLVPSKGAHSSAWEREPSPALTYHLCYQWEWCHLPWWQTWSETVTMLESWMGLSKSLQSHFVTGRWCFHHQWVYSSTKIIFHNGSTLSTLSTFHLYFTMGLFSLQSKGTVEYTHNLFIDENGNWFIIRF